MHRNRFAKLFATNSDRHSSRSNRSKAKPAFDMLDRRELMAASVSLASNALTVNGTEFADRVLIDSYTLDGPSINGIPLNIPMIRGTVSDANGIVVAQNSYASWYVSHVSITTLSGQDTVIQSLDYLTSSISTGTDNDTVFSAAGADCIDTGSGNDFIAAGEGYNSVYGGLGNDYIVTADGNDYVESDLGNDTIHSGGGNDTVYAGWGNDRIIVGSGDDVVDASEGDDFVDGQSGNDSIWGGTGNDTVMSGDGNDYSIGGDGNDLLHGMLGNDLTWGENGNDVIYGHDGDDFLFGGEHNDTLYAGAGLDRIYGENGDDLIIAIDGNTSDYLHGNAGTDSFWFDGTTVSIGVRADITDATDAEKTSGWVNTVTAFSNVADKTLDGDNIADPIDIGTKANFAHLPLFANAGPGNQDIEQGGLGDCWLMSALGEAAKVNRNVIRRTVVSLGDGTFGVKLGGRYYRVDGELPVDADGILRFAGTGVNDSIWAAVIEKAYAHYRTNSNTYASVDLGGWSIDPWNAIGANTTGRASFAPGNELAAGNYVRNQMAAGNAVVVNIFNAPARSGLVSQHAYMVDAVDTVLRTITLRNPWGTPGSGPNNNLMTVPLSTITAGMYTGNNGIMAASFPI